MLEALDVSAMELIAAALAGLGGVGLAWIEMRRARDDAQLRERTRELEVRLELLAARVDEIDEALIEADDEPEPPKPARARKVAR